MKLLKVVLLSFLLIGVFTRSPSAAESPFVTPNNRFGIHILDENDLDDAAALINSNGGDWGYVTIVIRNDQRDHKRWQNVFDKMRRLHLIPIVRIATRQSEDGWEKPSVDEIDGWISFLKELNWVIKNRYVVIGNEPNHAKEWGGNINPEEYGAYLETFSKKLKSSNRDFFILPAGLDASAPNGKENMGEEEFLKRMLSGNPAVFDHIDGWTSHSYPNPGFSGSEEDYGRGTVRTFEWELALLKSLGVNKNLPVFITETGWAHNMENGKSDLRDSSTIAERLKNAYGGAWYDDRIVAITPFVLNYQDTPFDIFSWKKKDGSFYDFYYEIKDLSKPAGKPKQMVSVDVLTVLFPPLIPNDGRLIGVVVLKNTGQNIWEGNERIYASNRGFEVIIEPRVIFSDIEPGERTFAIFKLKIKK